MRSPEIRWTQRGNYRGVPREHKFPGTIRIPPLGSAIIVPVDAQARYDEIADELATRDPAVALGKMFGMPCVKRNGKAGIGFYKGEMVIKLPDETHRQEALALQGAQLFDPMGGRPMREWVQVPATHADEWPTLAALAIKALP